MRSLTKRNNAHQPYDGRFALSRHQQLDLAAVVAGVRGVRCGISSGTRCALAASLSRMGIGWRAGLSVCLVVVLCIAGHVLPPVRHTECSKSVTLPRGQYQRGSPCVTGSLERRLASSCAVCGSPRCDCIPNFALSLFVFDGSSFSRSLLHARSLGSANAVYFIDSLVYLRAYTEARKSGRKGHRDPSMCVDLDFWAEMFNVWPSVGYIISGLVQLAMTIEACNSIATLDGLNQRLFYINKVALTMNIAFDLG